MKLIVGLGNPGKEFEQTRHNAGFIVLEAIAGSFGVAFQDRPKFKARIAEIELHGEKTLLVKPSTFYNLSGEAVRAISDFYKVETSNVLVMHDDMALPFGTVRTRTGGSDAGNNGIKSVSQHIGERYGRLRIGIWEEHRERTDATDFVLGRFNKAQQRQLVKNVPEVLRLCESFVAGAFEPHTFDLQ